MVSDNVSKLETCSWFQMVSLNELGVQGHSRSSLLVSAEIQNRLLS